jgi:PPOX class probable F420-dependent enzyme
MPFSDQERALLEAPNLAHFSTVNAKGYPHTTPVWVDVDGDDVLINSARGRAKVAHVEATRKAGLSVTAAGNPFHAMWLHGDVVEVTEEGARAHIDEMAKKYLGQDEYPFIQPGEVRVLIRLRPTRVDSIFW